MARRIRFETVMSVQGIPAEMRSKRFIIGRRTDILEMQELPSGFLSLAATVVRSHSDPRRLDYHSATDGSGIFLSEGRYSPMSFEAAGETSVTRARLDALQLELVNFSKDEIERRWHPSALAAGLLRFKLPGARALPEIVPGSYRDFDMERFDAVHEEHRDALSTYVFHEEGVYRPSEMPFISVRFMGGQVIVSVSVDDIDSHLMQMGGCIRFFSLPDYQEALDFASELAMREGVEVNAAEFTVEVHRPGCFGFDVDAAQFRTTGRRLEFNFRAAVGKMKGEDVALNVPMRELELARDLHRILENPVWRTELDELEAAINNCLDYEEEFGANRFYRSDDSHDRVLVEEWRNRIVVVEPKLAVKSNSGFL